MSMLRNLEAKLGGLVEGAFGRGEDRLDLRRGRQIPLRGQVSGAGERSQIGKVCGTPVQL